MLSLIKKEIKKSITHFYETGSDLSHFNWAYDLSWQLLKLSNNKHLQVWTRNSFYFNQYIPGLSDIDLSVRSKKVPKSFLVYKNILTSVFPWLGEVNWYPTEIMYEMCLLGNKIELSRDPELLKYLPERNTTQDIDRFIFLVRMMDYDISGLTYHPSSRVRKWSYHWDLVKGLEHNLEKQFFLKNLSLETIIDLALEFVPEDKHEVTLQALNHSFRKQERCDWLMPHKFLNLEDFKWDECEQVFPEATQAQVDWEFWGISGQSYWLPKKLYYEHLKKLSSLQWGPLSENKKRAREVIFNYLDRTF